MLTVYYTRWWIRQRFITVLIFIIDTTYSHYYWCVYVVYPNMMTIPGAMFTLGTGGGGGLSQGGKTTFPRASRKAPFFRKSKEKLWETQDYRKYIVINIVYWNYITIVNKNIFNQSWSCVIWYMKKKDYLLDEWFDFVGLRIADDLIMLLEKKHCIWFDYAVR